MSAFITIRRWGFPYQTPKMPKILSLHPKNGKTILRKEIGQTRSQKSKIRYPHSVLAQLARVLPHVQSLNREFSDVFRLQVL